MFSMLRSFQAIEHFKSNKFGAIVNSKYWHFDGIRLRRTRTRTI